MGAIVIGLMSSNSRFGDNVLFFEFSISFVLFPINAAKYNRKRENNTVDVNFDFSSFLCVDSTR